MAADDRPARRDLAEGLAQLETTLRTMADRTGQCMDEILGLIRGAGPEGIDRIRDLEPEVYRAKREAVQICVDLLALHGPFARDLRRITATLEIATDLDRLGRYSKDIADLFAGMTEAERASAQDVPPLARVGELTTALVRRALSSYFTGDLATARALDRDDNEIDDLHEEVFRGLVGRIADRSLTPNAGASLILVNRYFERMADHAVNIGSHVEYMLTGIRPRG
ncbi:MAG: phosphate uptake regulator PhoU [Thermoplasmata archaeon]